MIIVQFIYMILKLPKFYMLALFGQRHSYDSMGLTSRPMAPVMGVAPYA